MRRLERGVFSVVGEVFEACEVDEVVEEVVVVGGADFGDYLVGNFCAASVEDSGESLKFVFHNL